MPARRMKPVTLDPVQVDRCSHCQGIWFDAQEAELLRKVPGSESIDIGSAKTGEGWSTMYASTVRAAASGWSARPI